MTTLTFGPGSGPFARNEKSTDWQHERFSTIFRNVLNEYVQRAILEGNTQDDLARHYARVEIVDRAIQMRNIDLIVTCHQHLLYTDLPAAVDVGFHVMKLMIPANKKVSSILTRDHIRFCESVIPMFPFEFGMSVDECHAVIAVGFEDISKANQIISYIEQGVTSESAIRLLLAPKKEERNKLRYS